MNDDNAIVNWYKNDKALCELLVAIDQKKMNEFDSAREAFYQVSELFNLPKFPEDVIDSDKLDCFGEESSNVSVYEQLAIIKWIHPENTLRANVMLAMLYVYRKFYSPIIDAALEFYGDCDRVPESCYAYFSGADIDVQLKFDNNDKTVEESSAKLIMPINVER